MKTLIAFAAITLLITPSQAAVVWSGNVDIPIPPTTGSGAEANGVYVSIFNGSFQHTADDSFLNTQVNFSMGGTAFRSGGRFTPARLDAIASNPIVNLLPGSSVNVSLNLSPQGIGTSDDHLGSGSGQFSSGDMGYIGFGLHYGFETHYGWMRVTLTDNGTGTIHEWAYDDTPDTPIAVGVVPEPSSTLLFGVAGLCVAYRRSRH